MLSIDSVFVDSDFPGLGRVIEPVAPAASCSPQRNGPSHTGRRPASEPLNELHAAARLYDAFGLPITVCRGKAPRQTDWPNHEWTARTIDDTFRLYPASNVGLILGPRSGLVDFECDSPEAEQTLLELFEGDIPETPTWQSTRGLHRLFKFHPALEQLGTNKLRVGGDGSQLDLLIGPCTRRFCHRAG